MASNGCTQYQEDHNREVPGPGRVTGKLRQRIIYQDFKGYLKSNTLALDDT